MKAMVLGKFALVALVLCVGMVSTSPSEKEFNLFCRILAETERMITDVTDYAYDENRDREIVKEMEVLFNATTGNMKDFRETLWEAKDFLKEHPPPTRPESRKKAHNEIGNLIKEGEEKIEENKKIALEVNKKIDEAKLSVLKGLYGEEVTEIPREEEKMIAIQNNSANVFNSVSSANESCGNGNKTGKTLINDIFCACIGEGAEETWGPCHGYIMAPKRRVKEFKHCCKDECCKNNCNQECCKDKKCCTSGNSCKEGCCQENGKCCCESNDCATWTQMKYYSSSIPPYPLAQGIEKIEEQCKKELDGKKQTEKIPALLKEYVKMIGFGGAKNDANNKINTTHMFGQSGWGANDGTVNSSFTGCTGSGTVGTNSWSKNNNICVDYTKNYNEKTKTYDIPWHNNFREASEKMDQAKKLEDQILKNRAALLLLKSQAWVAYSREKDDETSNLDDMNISNLFDSTQLPPSFPLPFLFPFLFMIS